uniref:Uncharacterized protein n=1 Tax=Oryza meridionalis TaxID=40149 RepID=A0A0E0DBR1_9ORYZ
MAKEDIRKEDEKKRVEAEERTRPEYSYLKRTVEEGGEARGQDSEVNGGRSALRSGSYHLPSCPKGTTIHSTPRPKFSKLEWYA